MKPFEVTLCFVITIFGAGVQANPHSSDYDLEKGHYWREYRGDVPRDAFPGGKDKRGKTTYIGQTFDAGCPVPALLPGQIIEAEQRMTYECGLEEHETKSHIQILCTRNPELFEWINTNTTDINKFKDMHLVSGGLESNSTVYIGRVSTGKEIAVGSILVLNATHWEGMYTTIDGTCLHVTTSFDVLTYKT